MPKKQIIKPNTKFNRLTILEEVDSINYKRHFKCICDCGNIKKVSIRNLKTGHTKSCGCLNSELTIKRNYKHGLAKTRFYVIWCNMKSRCYSKCVDNYPRYGGRGIKVCDRWLKFLNFRDDMYESYLDHKKEFGTKQTTIDRIDSKGNYFKKNCKWSTLIEQQSNTRKNKYFTHNGITDTMAGWSRRAGIKRLTIRYRINRLKMPFSKAIQPTDFRTNKPLKQ